MSYGNTVLIVALVLLRKQSVASGLHSYNEDVIHFYVITVFPLHDFVMKSRS